MVLDGMNSRKTLASWDHLYKPFIFLLVNFIATTITLTLTVVINAVVVDDGHNDYGYGLGWSIMTPPPTVAFVWTLIDMLICRFWCLHPVYSVAVAAILSALYISLGILTLLLYSWDVSRSGLPSFFFLLICAPVFIVYMAFAARVLDLRKKGRKAAKKQGKDNIRMSNLQQA